MFCERKVNLEMLILHEFQAKFYTDCDKNTTITILKCELSAQTECWALKLPKIVVYKYDFSFVQLVIKCCQIL